MGAVLARCLPVGFYLLGIGLILLVVSAAADHYDLWQTEWYVGEVGLGALVLGGGLTAIGIVVTLWQTRGHDG